jgi:hypothetical protein
LSAKYRSSDGEDVAKEILAPMRNVRAQRQAPAHSVKTDEFDRKLPKQQDELVGEVCHTLTKLRFVLSSHPKARNQYSPPDWLDSDKIVFY